MIEDAKTVAGLAIKMWKSHTMEELTEEFSDYISQGNCVVVLAMLDVCQKWAKEQGCTEFASDCELVNEDSLKFHLKMGFEEANRIICFTKKL